MRDASDKSHLAGIAIVMLALMSALGVLVAQPPTTSTTAADVPVADKVGWLATNEVAIRSINPRDQDFADLRPIAKSIGDARIVLLGGSREAATVNAKDRLVRFLHQEMGFDVLVGDARLFDAEELDRALDRGASPPADTEVSVGRAFAIQHPLDHPSQTPGGWPPPGWPVDFPRDSGPTVIRGIQMGDYGSPVSGPRSTPSDILNYVRATHKTGRPLHLAGIGPLASTLMRDDYTRQLFQLVDHVNANLARPADRKAIQSLVRLYNGSAGPDQWDKVLSPALEAISRLYDGLGRVAPNSPDAPDISFYRYTLADLGRYAAAKAGRRLRIEPLDPLIWMANVWRPGSKIVVWLQNVRATRDMPVSREFGSGVYTIAFSEIDNDNGVLEVLSAGQQPSLTAVEGNLESLLHATGKPYSFVDFRSLAEDHWLRQPLAARLLAVPAIASWPERFDGLVSIDLAVLKDRKK